jgi:hypothetical protein
MGRSRRLLCSRRPGRAGLHSPSPPERCCRGAASATLAPAGGRHAAIVPVAPVIVVGGVLAAAYAVRVPLVSRALSWWLGAKVTMRSVAYAPLTGRWTLAGVRVADRRGTPLCSFERAQIGSATRAAAGERHRRKQYRIELTRPEVVAVFSSIQLSSSNWSAWASRFRGGTASVVTEAPQEPESSASAAAPRVKLDVRGGLLLSLRCAGPGALAGGTRIINDVRLTDLDGVGDDLLSPRSMANLVEKLCSKAFARASFWRFDSGEARRNARRFSRNVLRRETRSMRALARVHIKRLRKNVSYADELLGGLPDMARFADAAKQGDTVLSHVEQWLKLIEKPAADGDAPDSDGGEGRVSPVSPLALAPEGRRTLSQSPHVAPDALAPSPPPVPRDQYLELDEGWEPSTPP